MSVFYGPIHEAGDAAFMKGVLVGFGMLFRDLLYTGRIICDIVIFSEARGYQGALHHSNHLLS